MNPRLVARLTNAGQRTGPLAVLGTRAHAWLNRVSRGRLGREWFGAPVLVLETVGRKSGERRSSPVVYLADGEAFVVVAAAGGTRTPAWWLNLRASGEGCVAIRGRRTRVRPRLAAGEERERLWRRYLEIYPPAQEYVVIAGRDFPLVVLDPA